MNNAQLNRIETYLNKFNPIKVMKMQGMEIRHSAILAWLPTPNETRGFGDEFLKMFLAKALAGQSQLGKPTALYIANSDLGDADIRLEWNNIDIFVIRQNNEWVFIIENKFHSRQDKGQLSEYKEKIKEIYKNEKNLKILILRGEEPEDENFAPIIYDDICEILDSLLDRRSHLISAEVLTFLKHY